LEEWAIGTDILAARMRGWDRDRTAEVVRASGRLPLGNLGAVTYDRLSTQADGIFNEASPHFVDEPKRAPISIELSETILEGLVDRVYSNSRIIPEFITIKPKRLIEPWICHLALSAALPDVAAETRLFGKPGKDEFKEVEVHLAPIGTNSEERRSEAVRQLNELVALFHQGMAAPLPFFPHTSWVYYTGLAGKRPRPADSLPFAKSIWRPENNYSNVTPEGEDPHSVQAFGNTCPLVSATDEHEPNPLFHRAALAIWQGFAAAWQRGGSTR
jgi:exonuclease V gamma subunit